jgi:phosphonoacetaldehyde hydrolase
MDIFIRNRPYTGPVKAVILDWAGTAVDYGSIGPAAVFAEVFHQHGVSVSLEEIRQFMGLMKRDHIAHMCGLPSISQQWLSRHGRLPTEADIDSMYRETEKRMSDAIARHAGLIPGLLDTMHYFRKHRIKVGTSTGYTTPMMTSLVSAARKSGYLPDTIVCASDVPRGRPFPYMCYLNAIRLEIFPMEAVVKIGDTLADIHEGLNAGMWTVGVTKTGNEMGLTEMEAQCMPPETLEQKLKAIENKFRNEGVHFTAEGIYQCSEIIEKINEKLAIGELPAPNRCPSFSS